VFYFVKGKEDIMKFKQAHAEIEHNWSRIYTKIFNEKKTRKIRATKRLEQMTVD